MRERILVPLDGSRVGESALPYVEDLLSKLSSGVEREVVLLRVVAPITVGVQGVGESFPDVAATQKAMEQSEKEALEYLDKVREAWGRIEVTVIPKVAIGDAPEQIVKVAEDMDADMIAISTHGRSGLSRWAFGSVTHKVLHWQGRIPIVVIRAPGKSQAG